MVALVFPHFVFYLRSRLFLYIFFSFHVQSFFFIFLHILLYLILQFSLFKFTLVGSIVCIFSYNSIRFLHITGDISFFVQLYIFISLNYIILFNIFQYISTFYINSKQNLKVPSIHQHQITVQFLLHYN